MAHNLKYKKTTPTVVRCPMFITCQKELDFDKEQNPAMDTCLPKFHFKNLTTLTVAGIQQYLRDNAIDCIVWTSIVACQEMMSYLF